MTTTIAPHLTPEQRILMALEAPKPEPWQERILRHHGPMHGYFGLSYSNYLVLHRSLIQEMPIEWQERMVSLLDDYWTTWKPEADQSFEVHVRGDAGRFTADPLSDYRHPSVDLIDSLRQKEVQS